MGEVTEAARLICSAEFGKEWEDATDQERQKSIAMGEEMREIINAPWPTHLAGKTTQ